MSNHPSVFEHAWTAMTSCSDSSNSDWEQYSEPSSTPFLQLES